MESPADSESARCCQGPSCSHTTTSEIDLPGLPAGAAHGSAREGSSEQPALCGYGIWGRRGVLVRGFLLSCVLGDLVTGAGVEREPGRRPGVSQPGCVLLESWEGTVVCACPADTHRGFCCRQNLQLKLNK